MGNGSSWLWFFFESFTENSSSFFFDLSLLLSGFSSVGSLRFPVVVSFYFGTDEAAQIPTQVFKLQGTFSSRLPERPAPVLLPQARVPQGPKAGAHAGLVGQT